MSFLWLRPPALGVLLACRCPHFVVDEKLAYADGTAAAETIVMDPPREASEVVKRNALRAFRR
jgi:uncharacterized oligopeptide transporter (OPT) family protein